MVFYPAGFTWVDGCERDPARARAANLEQPLNLARAAAEVGARFVYFSTDYVFDGLAGPYAEDGPDRPLSAYGRAKREAEVALAEPWATAQLTAPDLLGLRPRAPGEELRLSTGQDPARRAGRCPARRIRSSSPSYGPDVALAAVMAGRAGGSRG